MESNYIKWRKQENIRTLSIPNKEKYYDDLGNIEHSWSGRIDANNIFIMEAAQLLINSMELFEMGYFDSAYYSLRTSIEISTIMVYLADMPIEKRSEMLDNWTQTRNFPMQSQMINQLISQGYIFRDMKDNMPHFFNEVRSVSKELNKYVHKQGFQHFYLSRNHPVHRGDPLDQFISAFEQHLKECIGVVAVMRLAIDPFPILLKDEEILYRCFDSLTEPYSDAFIEEYIGWDTVEEYKNISVYKGTYDAFMIEEKKNEAVFEAYKNNYIDTTREAELIKQLHLLPKDYAACVVIACSCEKVTKLYLYGGMVMFFTDRHTNRQKMEWSGFDFKVFADAPDNINQQYDEAFISTFEIEGETLFVEHNEQLDSDDVAEIKSAVDNL